MEAPSEVLRMRTSHNGYYRLGCRGVILLVLAKLCLGVFGLPLKLLKGTGEINFVFPLESLCR